MTDAFDLVVVGSGFGAAPQVLRGVQRGWRVAVIERGRRWPSGQFARQMSQVNDVFWDPQRNTKRQGLYDMRLFDALGVVCASGYGGGSLVYANILIRPPDWVFAEHSWPKDFRRQSLDPYFDRVEAQLNPSPMPSDHDVIKRNVFAAAASAVDKPIFDPAQAVAWQGPSAGASKVCQQCAECEFGCNRSAKSTLDLNYLRQAEQLGAQVFMRHEVSHLDPDPGGGYVVHGTDLNNEMPWSIHGARVVLAAGTLGTNEILLRCRDQAHTLPRLSQTLGQGFSGNGDLLGSIHDAATDLQPWVGTDVTSVIDYTEATPQFTMAAPTFSQGASIFLRRTGQPQLGDRIARMGGAAWPHLSGIVQTSAKFGLFDRIRTSGRKELNRAARATNLFCIGRDNAGGQLSLQRKGLQCHWNYWQENAALVRRQLEAMRAVSDVYGGRFAPVFSWSLFRKTLSVHPLGGARMAESPDEGVVDAQGEVFHYPKLYVADGAAVPTAIGFHPCLTIAAVSERIAEQMH